MGQVPTCTRDIYMEGEMESYCHKLPRRTTLQIGCCYLDTT
uniref:Uncharacterized protein n=1 Tax=Anguilla anguilla TaxID=7936 RepID=A0A0E9W601_ANGAN